MILKIKGDIVSNEWKKFYDWFGIECTVPKDVEAAIENLPKGDRLQVKINSGGGDVLAGQEIYSMLRKRTDVDIEVESLAASAASVIAMAGHSTISPVGMIMIHDVSTYGVSGNHRDLSKQADILKKWDEELASAYVSKTGKSKEEILSMMDKETWLTAQRSVELGFIDSISEDNTVVTVNSLGGLQVTADMIAQYELEMKKREIIKNEILKDLDKFGG